MMSSLPPGSLLVLAALLVPFLRGRSLQALMLAAPVISFMHLMSFESGFTATWTLFDLDLTPIRVDRLSLAWGYVFHIAAFLSSMFALHVKDKMQHAAGLVYAGAAISATFAGDLVSLFLAWEITATSSVWLVWATRTRRAWSSGMRYLIIQVCSGVLLLAGAIFHANATGDIGFHHFGLDGSLGTTLIFLAFALKAGFPLLHNWLQDAYPNATPTGTVFLSAFTTKLAIYALARCFAGEHVLLYIGAVMTVFPVIFAVIENDLRKVLAYSLNNQLGFMVVGIGIGTELAINGVAAHAFAHIIYKALLFMTMGAVLMRTGTTKASELGGLYKSMPLTAFFCIVGAASIAGFPLFSGFVSKSMIITAVAGEHSTLVYLTLLFASAGVMEHSGIKIPFFAFFAHDSGKRPEEAPTNMLVAMGIAAGLCFGIGVYPQALYGLLPYPVDYVPYTIDHVVTMMQLLLGAAVAFGVLNIIGAYPEEKPAWILDSDWVCRRAAPAVLGRVGVGLAAFRDGGVSLVEQAASRGLQVARHLGEPEGRLGRPVATGRAAFSVAVLLTLYMLLFFQLGELDAGGDGGHGVDDGHPTPAAPAAPAPHHEPVHH